MRVSGESNPDLPIPSPARYLCATTAGNILRWNFAHDFVLLYYRTSSSIVSLCQFLYVPSEYGMVMSVRPFSALFSYMPWHIELKFCTWLCFNVLQVKFECRHFASIFKGVMPLCELSVRPSDSPSGSPSARFPHFSHTCHDILSWNFAHDFVLMYYRSSLSVVTLRQFLKELCLFVNLEYR